MKVGVTIGVLNEEANIGQVLDRVPEGYDVLILDDGSTDSTVSIAEKYGAKIISHLTNLGQGFAVITSFKVAILNDYDVIIEMDGDGQHDPLEIPKFIKKMEETGADIVVGSRAIGTNYDKAPFFRKTFLPYFTLIINKLSGYNMTDSMCGFRAFRASSLQRVAHIFDDMLEPQYLAAEMFLRFSKEGLTVEEVPINLHDRGFGFSYKGLFRYGWGVTRAIIRTLMVAK